MEKEPMPPSEESTVEGLEDKKYERENNAENNEKEADAKALKEKMEEVEELKGRFLEARTNLTKEEVEEFEKTIEETEAELKNRIRKLEEQQNESEETNSEEEKEQDSESLSPREKEDSKEGWWERVKEVLKRKEVQKQVGKSLGGAVASIAGIKSVYDVPAYVKQKLGVHKEKKEYKELFSNLESQELEKEELEREKDKEEKEKEKMKEAEKLEKESDAQKAKVREAHEISKGRKKVGEVIDTGKVEDMQDKVESMDVSEEIKNKLMEELNTLVEDYYQQAESLQEKKNEQITHALDDYIRTKISGIQAAKEAANSACVGAAFATGGAALSLRGVIYGLVSTAERGKKVKESQKWGKREAATRETVSKEYEEKMRQQEEQSQQLPQSEKKEKTEEEKADEIKEMGNAVEKMPPGQKEISVQKELSSDKLTLIRETIIGGMQETYKGLTFQGEEEKKKKGMKFAKAMGSTLRFVGIGGTALAPFADETLENIESKYIDQILDNLGLSELYASENPMAGSSGAEDFVEELKDNINFSEERAIVLEEVGGIEKFKESGLDPKDKQDQELIKRILKDEQVDDHEIDIATSGLDQESKIKIFDQGLQERFKGNPEALKALENNQELADKILKDDNITSQEIEVLKSDLSLKVKNSLLEVPKENRPEYLELLNKAPEKAETKEMVNFIKEEDLDGLKEYVGDLNALTQEVEQGDTLTEIVRERLRNADDNDLKESFIDKWLGDHEEITDDNREQLLENAINKMSVANLETGDGNDLKNLIYEGNKVKINAETGGIDVVQGEAEQGPEAVTESELREGWADQRAENIGLDPDKTDFSGEELGEREISTTVEVEGQEYEVEIDDKGNWSTEVGGETITGQLPKGENNVGKHLSQEIEKALQKAQQEEGLESGELQEEQKLETETRNYLKQKEDIEPGELQEGQKLETQMRGYPEGEIVNVREDGVIEFQEENGNTHTLTPIDKKKNIYEYDLNNSGELPNGAVKITPEGQLEYIYDYDRKDREIDEFKHVLDPETQKMINNTNFEDRDFNFYKEVDKAIEDFKEFRDADPPQIIEDIEFDYDLSIYQETLDFINEKGGKIHGDYILVSEEANPIRVHGNTKSIELSLTNNNEIKLIDNTTDGKVEYIWSEEKGWEQPSQRK
jgi:hypothetical protein